VYQGHRRPLASLSRGFSKRRRLVGRVKLMCRLKRDLEMWTGRPKVSEHYICEVQVHVKNIYEVKKKCRSRYVTWRNLISV
jgi:hypothetical protein